MNLPFSEACERNKVPIADALEQFLPESARVLEIGAGTGQHAVYFTQRFPQLNWLATDRAENLEGLRARVAREADNRRIEVRELDVSKDHWPAGPFDAVYTANTLHIMPFELTPVLIEHSARLLRPDGQLICYGPFQDNGVHTSESNANFDQSLKSRDPKMGIRDANEIRHIARLQGLDQTADLPLPANNRLLIFTKNNKS